MHGSLPGWSHFCVGSAFWCWRVASLQVRDMFVFVARALSSCARLSFRQDTCFFNYYVVYLSFWETFFLSFQQVTLSPRWLAVGASYMWLSMVSDPAAGSQGPRRLTRTHRMGFRFRKWIISLSFLLQARMGPARNTYYICLKIREKKCNIYLSSKKVSQKEDNVENWVTRLCGNMAKPFIGWNIRYPHWSKGT